MKIGFFIFHRIDGRGGLENALIKIVDNLKKLGDESFLLFWENTIYPEFLEQFEYSKIAYHEGRVITKVPFLPKFINRQIQKKRDYLQMGSFFKKEIVPLNLDALIIIDLPDTLVQFQKILVNYQKKHSVPILSWIHGSLIASTPKQIKRTTKLLPIFSRHLTVSQGITDELKKIYQISNVVPVHNPIDQATIVPRGNNNFVYIGRIGDPRKQVDRLLEALPNLKGKWTLDIFGSAGSEIKDIAFIKKIQSLNLEENIVFHGWINDPWSIIKKADLLLLNSYTEGFGLVLAEAMMRGIPCVSSDCPVGPREIIQHGNNGWLFKVNHEEVMISLLQEIIDKKRDIPSAETIQNTVLHYRSDLVAQNFKEKIQEVIPIEK